MEPDNRGLISSRGGVCPVGQCVNSGGLTEIWSWSIEVVGTASRQRRPDERCYYFATLQWGGIVPSFSRPSVSSYNLYFKAMFKTFKYQPKYLSKPFEDLKAVESWVR